MHHFLILLMLHVPLLFPITNITYLQKYKWWKDGMILHVIIGVNHSTDTIKVLTKIK